MDLDLDKVVRPFEIWYDHRENPKVKLKIQAMDGVIAKEMSLPVGDLIIPHAGVAIERKAIGDFISSIYDAGKVFRQLEEIKANYPHFYLVLHGDPMEHLSWVRGDANRTHRTYLSGLVGVARMGIPILPARTDEEYLEIICALARQSDPDKKPMERPIQTHKPSDRSLAEEQEDTITAIRGIGREKARVLLNRFGTPAGVLSADPIEIAKLDKFGKTTAEHIREVGETKYGNVSQT